MTYSGQLTNKLMNFDPDDVWLDSIKEFDHLPQQLKRRLYRVAMVGLIGATYLLDTILLFLFTLTDTIRIEAPLYYGLAGLGHVMLFSLLQWTGFSERLKNPHMTTWQMAYGISVQLMSITLAPQISPFFLATMFVIFSFGMLRISFHQALVIWFLSVIAIATTMILNSDARLTIHQPSKAEYLLILVSFALILLRSIALGYYAQALRQRMYQLSRTFEDKATHDALTGIYNRRVLTGILEEQLSLHSRKAIPCSLAMIDIDHFKRVNDSYGHVVGDQVLKTMVKVIQTQVRDTDKLVRYGGEEFLLVMAATDLDEASVLAERIRTKISSTKWEPLPDKARISLSLGLTMLMEGDCPVNPLNRADAALYSAKKGGRNRVVIHNENTPPIPNARLHD
jgi:diguanylate cyclase (GGDEF)-like protein